MYYYHVWETRHPRLVNGKPLYETDIYSPVPIENKTQIMSCLKEQDMWYELIKNKDYEVVPMSGIVFIFNLITNAIYEKIEEIRG